MAIDPVCYPAVLDPIRLDVHCNAKQYGYISCDLDSGLTGSRGLSPGSNVDDGVEMAGCEAAPDITGKRLDNSLALVLRGAELLVYAGRSKKANAVRNGVRNFLESKTNLTPDLGWLGFY